MITSHSSPLHINTISYFELTVTLVKQQFPLSLDSLPFHCCDAVLPSVNAIETHVSCFFFFSFRLGGNPSRPRLPYDLSLNYSAALLRRRGLPSPFAPKVYFSHSASPMVNAGSSSPRASRPPSPPTPVDADPPTVELKTSPRPPNTTFGPLDELSTQLSGSRKLSYGQNDFYKRYSEHWERSYESRSSWEEEAGDSATCYTEEGDDECEEGGGLLGDTRKMASSWSGQPSIKGRTEWVRMMLLCAVHLGITFTWVRMTFFTPLDHIANNFELSGGRDDILHTVPSSSRFDKESDISGVDRRPFIRPHRSTYSWRHGGFHEVKMGTQKTIHRSRISHRCRRPDDPRLDQRNHLTVHVSRH